MSEVKAGMLDEQRPPHLYKGLHRLVFDQPCGVLGLQLVESDLQRNDLYPRDGEYGRSFSKLELIPRNETNVEACHRSFSGSQWCGGITSEK